MKKIILLFLFIGVLFFPIGAVYASSSDLFKEQVDSLDLKPIENIIDQIETKAQNPYLQHVSLKEMVIKASKGEVNISFSALLQGVFREIIKEVYDHLSLIRRLLFISILCALLKNLNTSFQSKSVGEIGFYVCYIVLIMLLFQSFQIAMDLTNNTINELVLIMQALLPTMITLMLASGSVTTASLFQPLVLFIIETFSVWIRDILVPLIFFTAVLEIINHLSEKEVLNQMVKLFKQMIGWSLKGTATLFIAILSLQGLTVPIADGVVNKAAKYAVGNFVPVVGGVLTGAVDTVLNCSLLIKNGVGIAAIVVLTLICAVPIIKISALILVYKCTAAVVQPISDERIVKCMDQIGSSCSLLLGSTATVAIMFMIAIVMMIGMGNMSAMMR